MIGAPASTQVQGPIPVPSIEVERSTRRLMLTLAQHRRQESLLRVTPRPMGRLRALPTSSVSHQSRAQSTLLRLVSILEAHIADQLVELIESHAPPPRTTVLQKIYVDAEEKALANWASMTSTYKELFSIKFSENPEWTKLLALIDARHAVAHGLGAFTRRQTRKNLPQLITSLETIGLKVDETRIEISEDALQANCLRAWRFLLWLDDQLRSYDAIY
jgi:hypothetical protein